MSSQESPSMLDNTKELDRVRKEQDEAIVEINKIHKKLLTMPEVIDKPGDVTLSRLRFLYTHAKELADSEVNLSTMLINQIDALLPSGPSALQRRRIEGGEQKKRRVKTDGEIFRPSSSVRNQLDTAANLKGEQVAARVTPDNAEKDEWFVVKVTHFDREARVFDVLDEEPGDDEDGSGQRKYKLPMSHIIPFPKKNEPCWTGAAGDYPTGKHVLAVYPGTTALYKATVVNQHRKKKTDDYLLEFDDDEEEDGSLPQRTVPFHRVVALPDGHRQ